ncbi:hypothetical protein [Acrocarpospora catenulata]|uniref:hypothetical protein n=1 Tax=Acrocarpospora catenulata TaxID=2836182 RepID=UPI001BDAD22F|nr:hypothetical protein [Acrocarpospora catenulata]
MLSELTATLEKFAAARDGILGVLPTLVLDTTPTGWVPAVELAREPYPVLAEMVQEIATRWNAPLHVAGALFWKTYTYWHTLPMAVGWAVNRRVPVMRPADTWVRSSEAGLTIAATRVTVAVLPGDPVAGEPGTLVNDDLGAVIRAALLDSQLPVIEALGRLTRVGRRNLWGSTAEALTHPLLELGPYGWAAELLAAVGRPVNGLIEQDGAEYRRRTCCLWVTLPEEDPCATCCVQSGRSSSA